MFRQDIQLPGISAGVYPSLYVDDVVLESPLLVVAGRSSSGGRVFRVCDTVWVKVFQLTQTAADNLMKDLNSAASLVKTLQFPPPVYALCLLCTKFVLGCVMVADADADVDRRSLVLFEFEKTALLDAATLPEQTERITIHNNYNLVDMNTTSLVFVQNQRGTPEGQVHLCKKDFWMSGTTQTNIRTKM